MRKISAEKLEEILEKNRKWLIGKEEGEKAIWYLKKGPEHE
ncbi:MAG: hypothetical protein SOW41_05940 [Anaerococcus sp.]|nr:hypothetical protein [Peptoniphilaceae bacterium]MDY3055591.1 hypothetical protein [Anaerococcus sp.]